MLLARLLIAIPVAILATIVACMVFGPVGLLAYPVTGSLWIIITALRS